LEWGFSLTVCSFSHTTFYFVKTHHILCPTCILPDGPQITRRWWWLQSYCNHIFRFVFSAWNMLQLALCIHRTPIHGLSQPGFKHIHEKQLHLYRAWTEFFFLLPFPKQYSISSIFIAFTLY
jgi:hypothetical protein